MTTIELVGLEFYGYHGVPDAEQEIGHRYRMDLVLMLDDRTYRTYMSDETSGLVDYSQVAGEALAIAQKEKVRTLEFLVERIGQHLLATFPLIQELDVRVAKIAPPMPFILEEVAVSRKYNRANA